MLLVQTMAALTLSAAAVLAPAVAPLLGLAPERVGLYAAVAYLAAMLFGLRAGQWVARWGALRLSQVALAAAALGALVAGVGPAGTVLLAAVAIGVGYGLVNPAATAVLAYHVPVHARGLYFSIKQTGVPIGVALAGLSMPLGLATLGWRSTVLALAGACIALLLLLQPMVARLEPPPITAAPVGAAALLRQVWRTPALRRLSLTSLAYAMTQQCFVTFIVSLLHLELGWSLAAAAGLLALSQAVSTASRVGFGALADRWRTPAHLLALLGVAMGLACVALALPGPGTTKALVFAAALACSATAMGWNGVFFAQLAHSVPREQMARISGATQFFTFTGGMVGPLLFGEFVRAGGSYALAYAGLALVPATAGVLMWRQAQAGAAGRGPG